MLFYIVRLFAPSIATLVVFILFITKDTTSFQGIPDTQRALDLKIHHCFDLAGQDDREGIGTKLNIPNCTTLVYYPRTNFTEQIMRKASETLSLTYGTDVRPVDTIEALNNGTREGGMYGVQFDGLSASDEAMDNIKNLSILILYNQSYSDLPNFLAMYNEEKFAKQITFNFMGMKLTPANSFPLIIQTHVTSALLGLYGITYDPYIRQNPYISEKGQPSNPLYMITSPLTNLLVVLQFVFTYVQMSQDK